MSVAENVGYGLRFRDPPRGVSKATRIQELLDLVDLQGMGDRDPEALSGGQQQRVALARALAPGPELLLLDEPMSALDARLRERLRHTVREIQTELDITTVYVTHDQAEALAISDRIAVLNDGRLEQIGAPEDVYREPASRFVAGFVGDNNLFEVDDVREVDGATIARSGDLEFRVAAPVAPGAMVAVRPESMHVGDDENVLRPTVESVEFLADAYNLHCRLDGRDLLVKTDRAPDDENPVIGFPAEAVRVLPE
jgi:thiamine transport system ATP-binding protein